MVLLPPLGELCGPDILLHFDRDNPIERARYSIVATAQVRVTRCIRYTTTTQGQRVCAETATVTEPRQVHRSGRLRPYRVR